MFCQVSCAGCETVSGGFAARTVLVKRVNLYLILLILAVYMVLSPTAIASSLDPSCGVDSLYHACVLLNLPFSYEDVIARCDLTKTEGMSMYDLFTAAGKLGLSAMGMRMSYAELLEIDSPAIAWINKNHFVLVDASIPDNNKIRIIDGFEKPYRADEESFSKVWSGEILLLSKPTVDLDNTETGNSQSIVFDSTVHDFGTIQEGEIVTALFPFENVGDKAVEILRVLPSCNCTAVLASSKSVSPGATGEIKVTLDSLGRLGRQRHTVRVMTTAKLQSKVSLSLLGVV